jgi:hypothetical protein
MISNRFMAGVFATALQSYIIYKKDTNTRPVFLSFYSERWNYITCPDELYFTRKTFLSEGNGLVNDSVP